MADPATKASLRRSIGARVTAIPAGRRAQYDESICELIRGLDHYRNAIQLCCYWALRDEASLALLLSRARADGKRIFLPVVEEDWALRYHAWVPGEPLLSSALGVEEPADRGRPEPSVVATLTLVPGRVFDVAGYRVGRGRGCFDRSLETLARLGPTIGVAYSCQIVTRVPRQEHDRPVDMVVTETGIAAPGHGGDAAGGEAGGEVGGGG